nr:MAG TPA: hypothetical protein [Crassvirales sp.]
MLSYSIIFVLYVSDRFSPLSNVINYYYSLIN